jgi:hypothetical protein
MDTVMVGDKEESDADVSFKLRFTKSRRRNPQNREDYREMVLELRDGKWTSEQPQRELNPSEEIALQALRNAIAEHDDVVSEDVWREHAYKLGISTSDQARAKQQAFKRAKDSLLKQGGVKREGAKFDIARA